MAKDSYWFRHDTTAGRGLKMLRMTHKFDHWGKGVYWDVCEVLRSQQSYQFSSAENDLTLLADMIGVRDTKRFVSWFKESTSIGLLQKRGKFFYSPALSENMKTWEKNKKNGETPKTPKPEGSQLEAKSKPNGSMNKNKENNNRTERENNESEPYSRPHIFSKMESHIRKNLKKYYPAELAKGQAELAKIVEAKGWTQEKIDLTPALAIEFDKVDQQIFERHIGGKMRNEMQECFDYYSARNFRIDGEPISSWPSVMAGWMKRRKFTGK